MTGLLSSIFFLGIMPSCLTALILVFLVSLTIRTGKTQRESQLFAIICLLFLAHHAMIILPRLIDDPALNLTLIRMAHLVMIFFLPVSVHYVLHALKLPRWRIFINVLYLLTLFRFPLVLSDYYVYLDQGRLCAGPLLNLFLWILGALIVILSAACLYRLIKNPGHPTSVTCVFILIGLIPSYVLTFIDELLLMEGKSLFVSGFLFIPLGIFTYGILRNGILDNRGWFSMKRISLFLTALVLLPPAVILFLFLVARDRFCHPDVWSRLFPMALPALVSMLVCYGLAIFCFQKGSLRVKTMVFGGMCALWGLLNLDTTLLFILKDPALALKANRFDHLFLVMQLALISHLFYCIVGFRKRVLYLAYAISLIYVPLSQTDLYLNGMHTFEWGFFGNRGILFEILVAISFIWVLLGSRVLILAIIDMGTERRTRQQYIVFLLGILLMGLLGLSNLPAMSGMNFFPFASFMFVPVLIMGYGVFKYDMIKVNVYAKRRFWVGITILLTYTGYGLLAVLVFVTIQPMSSDFMIGQMMNNGIPLLISLVASLFFSVLSLRVGPNLIGSRLFGLICMVFAILSTDILLNSLVTDRETALHISRLCHIPLVMWPALYIHLMVLVCRKYMFMHIVRMCYVIGIVFALLTQNPFYLMDSKLYSWGYFAQAGPVFYAWGLFCFLVFVANLVIFWITFMEQAHHMDKTRLLLFSMGILAMALFSVGNIPAMSGYNMTPMGNFVFIPLTMMGVGMFRKNLKDVLLLLHQCFYILGVGGFIGIIAYGLYMAGVSLLSWWTVFIGIFFGWILFKGFDKIWLAVLSLFFGRQQEILDQLYLRMTDQLSQSRSLDDLAHFISDSFFEILLVKKFRMLFYSGKVGGYTAHERLNPDIEHDGRDGMAQGTLTTDHPLFPLILNKRGPITQAQVEAWIADMEIALDPDDLLRAADLIQPVYFEDSLISLLLFHGKLDGAVFSKVEQTFIGRLGLILGPYIANAKLLQGLETQIEDRTKDLSVALQVKNDFLARMSHEVRSPLNAILGMGELLRETPLSHEQSQYVDILSNSSGLLLSVISDILDVSKLDSGRVTLESVPFDLFRLMSDLKDIVAASSFKKGLSVTLSMDSNVNRYVLGDPYKLAQVIINLADNAIRFTDSGRVRLHVEQEGDDQVRFSVEDTGVGIPQDKLSLIFEKFSQAESSTTRRYGGSGLGLTICKKLVELMGGDIAVTSQLGLGSRFAFTILLKKDGTEASQEQTPMNTSMFRLKSMYDAVPEDSPIPDVPQRQVTDLLLVEDMTTNIRVITQYLKDQPVNLTVARDGEEAVRLFRSKTFGLVLMDIHMPRMDGYEAVRQIRTIEEQNGLARTPVIALTAHRPDESRSRQLAEFNAFLMKPISKKDLINTIFKLIPAPTKAFPADPNSLAFDPELAGIIPELIHEINEELPTITHSLENGDYDTASRLSHGFKGAAGNCGLPELSDMFKTLYDLATNRIQDKAATMVTTIRLYVNDLQRVIDTAHPKMIMPD